MWKEVKISHINRLNKLNKIRQIFDEKQNKILIKSIDCFLLIKLGLCQPYLVGDEDVLVDGHLLWDGEAVGEVVGKVLECLLHSRVQHVLPRLEPPDVQVPVVVIKKINYHSDLS